MGMGDTHIRNKLQWDMRRTLVAVLVLTACLTLVSASEDASLHTTADGLKADSGMGMGMDAIDLQGEAALETELRDDMDIDEMLSSQHQFGMLKKGAEHLKTAVEVGKKFVKNVKEKGVKGAIETGAKDVMNAWAKDKKEVGPAPPSAQIKKTWASWEKVIEAMRLCRETHKSRENIDSFLKKCGQGKQLESVSMSLLDIDASGGPKDFSKWSNQSQCDFFQDRTASMQLRKYWHEGSFEKHTGVDAFMASTSLQASDQLNELEIPHRLVDEAEKQAKDARAAAAKAAEFARSATVAAALVKVGNPVPTEVPADTSTDMPTDAATKAPTEVPTEVITEDNKDAGEIWVAFRGSNNQKDAITDVTAILQTWPYNDKVGNVHKGFLTQYEQVREQIKEEVLRLIGTGHTKLHITGHSLGGALAELCAMDAVYYTKGTNLKMLTMTSFGAPDPADATWAANYNEKVKLSTRVVYESGIVPCLPSGYKPTAKLADFANKFVGSPDAQKFKQVRTLLHFFRDKWRSIQWPKCDLYKQGIDDHAATLYLKAVKDHPIHLKD